MADVFKINVDYIAAGQQIMVECAAYKGKCSVYILEKGNTLTSVAAAFGTSVKTIVALNNIPNPDRVAAGQKLIVPNCK